MSGRSSPNPSDSRSVIGDADGESSPQTVDTTSQVPGNIQPSQSDDAEQYYSASNSAATATADGVAAATQATLPQLGSSFEVAPRVYIHFHINRDYNGALPSLTEQAVAALNHSFAHGSSNGNVGEWIPGPPNFSPIDPIEIDISMLRNPPTWSATGTGSKSSWSMISSPTPNAPEMEHGPDVACAGQQFDDVSAPINRHLLEEDCIQGAMPSAPRQPPDGDD